MSTTFVNGVEIGPDGIEWAITEAGYKHFDSVIPRADGGIGFAPYWHGWAVREAFVAGALWQRERTEKLMGMTSVTIDKPIAMTEAEARAIFLDNSASLAAVDVAPAYMRDFVPDIRAAAKDTGFNCNHTLTAFLENLLNRVLPKP